MIVAVLRVTVQVWYYNTEARYTRIVCSSSVYYFTLSSYALRWPLLPILMERRDSSLFPTLLSPFPSSFRLAQHSLWPTLPYMVNISAAVGVLIRRSSSLVEEPLGWLMRGKADVDSFDQGRTRRILTMPESSVHRAPTTTLPWHLSHEDKCTCRIFLRSECLFPLPHHLPVSAHDMHALAEC